MLVCLVQKIMTVVATSSAICDATRELCAATRILLVVKTVCLCQSDKNAGKPNELLANKRLNAPVCQHSLQFTHNKCISFESAFYTIKRNQVPVQSAQRQLHNQMELSVWRRVSAVTELVCHFARRKTINPACVTPSRMLVNVVAVTISMILVFLSNHTIFYPMEHHASMDSVTT